VRHQPLVHALLAAALLAPGSTVHGQKRPPAEQLAGPQPILRADFISQMDAQFGKMDADKSGQLSGTEIEQFERQQALAAAQARHEALFDQLDVNKNGQISATEFAKLMTEPVAVTAQPMLSREDRNRDGQVSLVEHRIATLANFDRIDVDRDGVVSVDEMKAGGVTPR
jgi:Ca2+-binding EF-hand superfamily protein